MQRRRTLVLAAVLTLAGSSPAAAGGIDPAAPSTLRADGTTGRDCAARPLGGARGVAEQRAGLPRAGALTVALRGARGDWDLAVFDAVSGQRVGSSSGFGADELVQVTGRQGAQLLLQACRRAGASPEATLTTTLVDADVDALLAAAKAPAALVEVALGQRDDVERLEAAGLDVTHDVRRGRARVVTYGDQDRRALARLGFDRVRTVVQDLRRVRRPAARAAQAATSALPSGRTAYREPDDFARELKALADANPGLVRALPSPGKTFQGRELPVVEIAQDVERRDDGRPVFLLNAMHHAREWPGPEGVMEFGLDLVRGFRAGDPRIRKLLSGVRVVLMPLTNLDGYIVSRGAAALDPDPDGESDAGFAYETATGVVLLGGSLSYKRKNCNPVGVTTAVPSLLPCELAIGVDNNRNYAESWGGPGASTNPNDQSFRGSGPFSEPETRAFRDLFSRLNATMMITTHTVAALVLRPPGLEADGFAPDEPALKALGDRMAAATGYTSQYGWQLYDTTGTTDDWSYAVSGGFGYTIEMGPEGGRFHGAYGTSVVDQYLGAGPTAGKGLREAYLVAAEAARDEATTSRVAGRAPAGRTLRLTKTAVAETYPVCAIAEPLPINLGDAGAVGGGDDPTSCLGKGQVLQVPTKLSFSTQVPASGSFEWWVNPSTRPFELKAGKTETYRLDCLDGDRVLETRELVVGRGETAQLELPCGGTLPAPPATGKGAAPAPRTGVRVKLGKVLTPAGVLRRRGRAIVLIGVRGGTLRGVRVQLLARRGTRVLAEGRVARLASSRRARRVALRVRRGARVGAGTLRLRLTARQAGGSPVELTRTTTVRAQTTG
jgi:hypothetical protein